MFVLYAGLSIPLRKESSFTHRTVVLVDLHPHQTRSECLALRRDAEKCNFIWCKVSSTRAFEWEFPSISKCSEVGA